MHVCLQTCLSNLRDDSDYMSTLRRYHVINSVRNINFMLEYWSRTGTFTVNVSLSSCSHFLPFLQGRELCQADPILWASNAKNLPKFINGKKRFFWPQVSLFLISSFILRFSLQLLGAPSSVYQQRLCFQFIKTCTILGAGWLPCKSHGKRRHVLRTTSTKF